MKEMMVIFFLVIFFFVGFVLIEIKKELHDMNTTLKQLIVTPKDTIK